jgi:putative ABC transport system ATP-binding protein
MKLGAVNPMFRLENVSKVYSRRGREVVAFRAASLEIPAGDYVAIVGKSGSGKTTLLSMLGGMLSPSAGRVWFEELSWYDLNVAQRAHLRREKIGFVFQTFNLVPYLTALENVQIPLYLAGASKQAQRERAAALLERVGLSDRLDHKPHELSVGQQQRVALARTLANNPPVILADEPTGNLDAESRKRVLDFLGDLHREGHTIVMVTHDVAAAERAQRTLVLSDGTFANDLSFRPARAA